MLSFDVAGCDTVQKAYRFMDALKMVMASSSLGDVYSVIVNPARSTHHWFDERELAALGIGIGTFRMSVGLEDLEDIKEDLDQALRTYQAG
jgi:O-succinylhomoserine sulfhydrylase